MTAENRNAAEIRTGTLKAARHATLGQLRELTDGLPDDTPIAVVTRKAHDPERFYETVLAEEYPHVDLTLAAVVVVTAPEPRDVGV